MKMLLTLTAWIEWGAGLVLLALPQEAVKLLLGSALEAPVVSTLARVAGAALLALGTACWFARRDSSRAATGVVAAMLVYNIGAVAVLALAGIGTEKAGVLLWPAVALHAAFAAACVLCLRGRRQDGTREP